ncbi:MULTISPECIES: DUF6588 family protein [unclassified Fibrobacter]|uniref:DUF6588 family protein n=1 Tax=unclassified Fibrobacter TaxID=2634177 RepID=UPI000D6A8490|nr:MULTISPECIES: DUF6588 family protein [unclassified Fibrobacter]PWJ61256.1 hypothetical protein BGX12_12929 [Fibrobacter sp. UWR4]PZW66095.1 hypothetical protein C8E88_102929 [Fibrobacter sp. UWR1]
MKKLAILSSIIALCSTAVSFAMDDKGWASTYESLAAFDSKIPLYGNRPGYVKPIIANLGNVLNSNWFVSAEVANSFSFEAGLPFSIIPIGDDDRVFNDPVYGGAEVPTIFGENHNMTQPYDGRIYGNETLNGLGVFTYPYLQVAASMFHARAVLRWMMLPAISELRGFSEFGFGLQYSFGHLFQYMLPPAAQGLNVSLGFGYNTSSISYQPEDYKGQLDLDVSTLNISLILGYKPIKTVEIMMSLGYQSAEMASGGKLTCMAKDKLTGGPGAYYGQVISPDLTIEGNNGFRFGLEVAFHLGASFNPVVGFDYAGKSSYTTNILYFKQQFGTDKTPDEIAKEKGYDRNAKSEPAAENKNENVRARAQESYDEPDMNTEEPETEPAEESEEE